MILSPPLWGVVSALGWGSADFIARFSGRTLGTKVALFGMIAVGAAALTVAVLAIGLPPAGTPMAWALVAVSGTAIVVGTLLLYDGLARGPVTVVAPIVGAYPVLNIAANLARGARPSTLEWTAMAAVLIGVVVVARSAAQFEKSGSLSKADIRRTIAVALSSAAAVALGVGAAQDATPTFGQLQTVWLGRIVSLIVLAILFAAQQRLPRIPRRWWPLVALQGLLDSGGYVAVLFGGHGPGSEIAIVIASSFSVVTVVLARLLLKESMSSPQWLGVAAIVAGIATLTATGK